LKNKLLCNKSVKIYFFHQNNENNEKLRTGRALLEDFLSPCNNVSLHCRPTQTEQPTRLKGEEAG